MLALYLLLGFFVGSQTSRMLMARQNNQRAGQKKQVDNMEHTESEEKQNDTNRNEQNGVNHRYKIRQRVKKCFIVNSNSPEGIDPETVSVGIRKQIPEKNKSSPAPNFIALTVLWAHYVANQLGLLDKGYPPPWEIAFGDEEGRLMEKQARLDVGRDSWKNFLSKIITDRSWMRWIKIPEEVKERTILAFES